MVNQSNALKTGMASSLLNGLVPVWGLPLQSSSNKPDSSGQGSLKELDPHPRLVVCKMHCLALGGYISCGRNFPVLVCCFAIVSSMFQKSFHLLYRGCDSLQLVPNSTM